MKYLFLYNVEKSLRDKDKNYASRASILLSAWEQLFVFLRSCNIEDVEAVMEDAFKFTFRFVLNGDWYHKLSSNLQSKFAPAIRKCLPLAGKLSSLAAKRCESLLAELSEPWMQPVLQAILRGSSVTDEEATDFLVKEGCQLLIIRLEVLCEEHCEDFALRLAERTVKNIDCFGSKAKNEVNILKDMYLTLLALNNRTSEIIHEISKIELRDGLNLVRRWHSKRAHSCGESDYDSASDEVCGIIAHTVLTSAMLQNVEDETRQRLLYELIKEWLMMLLKNGTSLPILTESIRKMLIPAESSIHIYMFCLVLKEFDYRYRSLCVEIFIRGLTFNMNEVELFKINGDTPNVLKSEARLSNGFLQLADVLKEKLLICRECVLTAFSLHPSLYCFNLICELAYLSQKTTDQSFTSYFNSTSRNKNDFKRSYLYNGKVKSGECLNLKPLFKKSSNGKLMDVVNVSPIDIFDSDSLELAPQLCDDLTTVLNSPRNLTLSWTLEWTLLKTKCVTYLEEFTKRHSIDDTIFTEADINACINELAMSEQPSDNIENTVTFNSTNDKSELSSNSDSEPVTLTESVAGVTVKPIVNISNLYGKELKRYLSNLNLNPRVVLTRTPIIEAITNKNKDIPDCEKLTPDKDDIFHPKPNNSSLILAQSIPGLNSLDMIIPESQEPTIQVVQVSNNNTAVGQSSVTTECQTVNSSDHSYKNTPIYSQSCSAPFVSSDNIKNSSHSDIYSAAISNSSQTLSKEKISASGWSQISRSSSEHSTLADGESESNSNCDKVNIYSSSGLSSVNSLSLSAGEHNSSNDSSLATNASVTDEKLKLCLENEEEGSDKAKKNNKFDFESREVNIGNSKAKSHSFIVKPKANCIPIKEDPKISAPPGSILRVIVRDCKNPDQYIPLEGRNDASKAELIKIANSGIINSYSCSEQLFKLICKKDKQDTSSSASLPNFQHVFGRQGYQSQNESSEENVSLTNCHLSSNQDAQKDGHSSSNAISKGIQTVSKDQVDTGKCSSNSLFSLSNSSSPLNSVEAKASGSDVQASSSLILAYKIPVSNNSVVQLKSTSVLKKSGHEISAKSVKSDGSQTVNPKESVIRNSMNFLLSAALKSPVKSISSSSISPSNSTISAPKVLQSDKKVGDNTPCQQKPKIALNVKKTIRKGTPVGTMQRVVKPVGQTSVMNNICQTEPSVVSIQVPLKNVQVISNDLNISESSISQPNSSNATINPPEGGTRNNSLASSPVEPNIVSSTTLEQLREFESVLEHITNTSQMKEKGTMQERLDDQHSVSSPPESLTLENKTTNFANALSVVESSTATSVCNTICKTNNSNTSTSSLLNAPKISASTSVVLVSRPVVSPALSVSSQSPVSPIPLSTTGSGCKLNPKISKSKTKSVGKTASPTSTLKVSNLPKPQQKPQEDEQTTQRIYAILDKYAEQLRNSPELKNKPAPRRRSNPPSNPSHSTKRKKSSHNKPKSNINLPSSGLELSPASEDIQTLGSEDSSNGVSQLSQALNSPQNADDLTTTSLGDFSSEIPDAVDKESHSKHQIVITDALQNSSGRTVIVQDNIQQSVINVDNTKLMSGKQVVVGGSNSVPLALLPAGSNVKQVIFPVSSDCRPLVVATKVPKMYRVVTTGGVPSGSPILSTGSSTVLLRQMCLNKASTGINLKPLKVPVMSSTNVNSLTQQAVVLPTTTQTIPLTSSNFSETFGVSLDNTIMLNSHSTSSVSLISNKRVNKVVTESSCLKSSPQSVTEVPVSLSTETKVESVIVSCQDPVVGQLSPVIDKDLSNSKLPLSNTSVMFREQSSLKLPNIDIPKRLTGKIWNQTFSIPQKEEFTLKDQLKEDIFDDKKTVSGGHLDFDKHGNAKGIGKKFIVDDDLKLRKDSFSVICTNESVIKSSFYNDNTSQSMKPSSGDSSNSEGICSKFKTDFLSKTVDVSHKDESDGSTIIFSQTQDIKKKCVSSDSPIFNVSLKRSDKSKPNSYNLAESLQSRLITDKELNLQKSLSEECEDLGVDRPSTSDLFPEAELILEHDPLSRESSPVEAFSRSLESSSSSHDSPSRSPIFGGKLDSTLWFKQNTSKKLPTQKANSNYSANKLQIGNLSEMSSKLKSNESSSSQHIISISSGTNCGMSNDIMPFTSSFGSSSSSLSSKLCDIVDSKSDSWSDDHDLCNFTELDESLDSYAEDDSNINASSRIKPFPDMSSEMINIAHSALSSDSSDVSLQECFNISDTGHCVGLSDHKNGLEVHSNTNTGCNLEGNSSNCLRKRKAESPVKYGVEQQLMKLKKVLLDSSDESVSSSDTNLADTNVCDRGHMASSARRSSSRGLIKKGCPCFSSSSVPRIKKKIQTDSNNVKTEKILYPSHSHTQIPLSMISKKSSVKQLKTSTKKR